jgi:TPR repeat protein
MGCNNGTGIVMIERWLAAAAGGETGALFDLGLAYANGVDGVEANLIEAHKWFNLAALNGVEEAQECRAEVADMMSAREIAEAQRQARSWLAFTASRERVAA